MYPMIQLITIKAITYLFFSRWVIGNVAICRFYGFCTYLYLANTLMIHRSFLKQTLGVPPPQTVASPEAFFTNRSAINLVQKYLWAPG